LISLYHNSRRIKEETAKKPNVISVLVFVRSFALSALAGRASREYK